MTKEDIAWAAGFFCGEGSTYVRSRKSRAGTKTYVNLVLKIAQCDPEPLYRFKAIFRKGNVNGPYHRPHPRKSVWMYSCDGSKTVKAILDAMWEHLGTSKRTQASTAISKWRKGEIGYAGRTYNEGIPRRGRFSSKIIQLPRAARTPKPPTAVQPRRAMPAQQQ